MLTSKQRAQLRALANSMDTIFQIGKEGIGRPLTVEIKAALEKRELIKLRVLETSLLTAREAAQELAEEIGAEVVQVIGTRFVLYKRSEKKPVIVLE